MAVPIPFCIRRPDRPGYWFDRRVPKDCQSALGIKHWRRFAGNTQAEARIAIAALLAETEALIQQARGSASTQPVGLPITREQELRLLQGRPELLSELAEMNAPLPDNPEALADLPVLPITVNTVVAADLIALGQHIKRPAVQTVEAWARALDEFTRVTGVAHLNLVTKQDAQRYRDDLLKRKLATSTVKLRLNYCSGLWRLAVEEGLLNDNPFVGLTRRLRADRKAPKVYDITDVDQKAKSLPSIQYDLYQILRFTGCRLAEVCGLHKDDVDFNRGILIITPHTDRPLKTIDSERMIPIHPSIEPTLRRLFTEERPFISFLKNNRWGAGIIWTDRIGLNPHELRHHFATQLRKNGVQELVVSKLLGHKPVGQTAAYGDVPFETLIEAVSRVS